MVNILLITSVIEWLKNVWDDNTQRAIILIIKVCFGNDTTAYTDPRPKSPNPIKTKTTKN